ncbi:hypothetical protein [Pseudomonas kitaguniensis]|uniref:hypothetical protein n=1 Tax=Pseudomonas kitaguniensis TaxID=2607908 RepID=UPI003CFC930A
MTDKMREEFIEAFVQQFGFGRMAASSNPDAAGMLACAEWAWFASRIAVVVELPPMPDAPEEPEEAIDDSHMDAYHSAIGMRHACAQFIKAAGLKVTP